MSRRTMIVYEPVKARLVRPRARLRLSGKDIEFMALTLVDRYMPLPPEPEVELFEAAVDKGYVDTREVNEGMLAIA